MEKYEAKRDAFTADKRGKEAVQNRKPATALIFYALYCLADGCAFLFGNLNVAFRTYAYSRGAGRYRRGYCGWLSCVNICALSFPAQGGLNGTDIVAVCAVINGFNAFSLLGAAPLPAFLYFCFLLRLFNRRYAFRSVAAFYRGNYMAGRNNKYDWRRHDDCRASKRPV